MANKKWYYFGCHGGVGHFLWDGQGRKNYDDRVFLNFDGKLCRKDRTELVARLSRLPGLGYSALAFWDYSIDSRSGSNSIIFAPSLTLSAEDMVEGIDKYLPFLKGRWPCIDLTHVSEKS